MYRLLGALGYLCGEIGRIRVGGLAPLMALLPTNLFFAGGCLWAASYSVGIIQEGRKINQTPDVLTIDQLVTADESKKIKTPYFATISGELHPRIRQGAYAAFRDAKTNKFMFVKTADEFDSGPARQVTLTGLIQKIPSDKSFGLGSLQKPIADLVGPGFQIGRDGALEEGTHPPIAPLWGTLVGASALLALASLAALRFNNLIFIREGFAPVREIDEYEAPSLENSGLRASGPYLEPGDPRPVLDLPSTLQSLSNGEIIVNAASMTASAALGRLVGRNVEVGTLYCGFGPPRQAVRINNQIVLAVQGDFPLERVVVALGATPANYATHISKPTAAMPSAA